MMHTAALQCCPQEPLTLSHDDVHVWLISLCLPAASVETLNRTLSRDERERVNRFHFQKDREQSIVGRGALRTILGSYLGAAPVQLSFCYNANGKPTVIQEPGADAVRFNLSHSHEIALIGIARGREIGVDVERIRPVLADWQIARRFFSPREAADLRSLPADVRTEAFFSCWTRKEAYLKARGEGLSCPLDQFDVSLIPGAPPALLSTRGDPSEVSRWSLQALAPAPGYVAAIAVEGKSWRLKCYAWPRDNPALQ